MKLKNLILFSVVAFSLFLFPHCKKEKKMPELTTIPVADIAVNSAFGGGEVIDDHGLSITTRGIVWSIDNNPSIENNTGSSYSDDVSNAFATSITSLTPATKYFVRAFASNGDGTGYGNEVSFTTIGENGDIPFGGTPCPGMPTFTDPRDQYTYNTVQIGSQCWVKQNLMYYPFISAQDDMSNTSARYYVYGLQDLNDEDSFPVDNYNGYGALYNWHAAITACPEGWHLPSSNEWKNLVTFLGENPGGKLKSTLSQPYPHPRWDDENFEATNESGFRGMPGGKVLDSAYYLGLGKNGVWWSSTMSDENHSNYFYLNYGSNQANFTNYLKRSGFSVRCIRDEEISVATLNTLPVSSISSNGAVGNGQIIDNGGEAAFEVGVCWSTSQYPTINNHYSSSSNSTVNFSVVINNLTEMTKYFVRAFAINSAGVSYGYTEQFITDRNEYTPCPDEPVITDSRDGNTYLTVLIGNQCWMRENLSFLNGVYKPDNGHYSLNRTYVYGYDSTIVSEAKTNSNYQNYGVLYNYPAALAFCPSGWHLPQKSEWETLVNFLGGNETAGGRMKSTQTYPNPHPRWNSPNTNATDNSFFSGFPGGWRSNLSNNFGNKDTNGYWWSSSEIQTNKGWVYGLSSASGEATEMDFSKSDGLSVRCIKDD